MESVTLTHAVAFLFGAVNHGPAMAESSVTELVERAGAGDQAAWNGLVDRFGNLVWSVVRGFRLDPASAADVSQTTWLRLVENLDRIREPERLAGWLATTARNESIRVLRHRQRELPTVDVEVLGDPAFVDPAADLIESERAAALVGAVQELSEDCQTLLRLLATEPPLEYEEIAELVERPIGSIGPTRARCLERLRRSLASTTSGTFREGSHEQS